MEHQQLPAVTYRFQQFTTIWLKKHILQSFSDRSVHVQLVMPSKLYSVGSHEELPVVHIFNISQYFVCCY